VSTTDANTCPPSPASVIRELLDAAGLSQTDLARAIGVSTPRLSMLLTGRRAMTPEVALRLSRVFDVPPLFWLQLHAEFELHREAERLETELERLPEMQHSASG
jgi:addiction module HigA family antidote